MADEADRAAEAEDLFLRAALFNALRGRAAFAESAAECEDCGEAIPQARRQAVPGCIRCVRCQNDFERATGGIR